jgi:hypothetical protein
MIYSHLCELGAGCWLARDRAHPDHDWHTRLFRHMCPFGATCPLVNVRPCFRFHVVAFV